MAAARRPRLLRVTYALPRSRRPAELRVYLSGRHGPAARIPLADGDWHTIRIVLEGRRLTVRGK